MERQLEELSQEAEQLQAALWALGAGDEPSADPTSRAHGTRRRQVVEPGAARQCVPETLSGQPAPAVADTVTPTRLREGAAMKRMVEEAAAGAPGGWESRPLTGVDRAIQELRRELTAALRSSRG
jgi:hypothetical protein